MDGSHGTHELTTSVGKVKVPRERSSETQVDVQEQPVTSLNSAAFAVPEQHTGSRAVENPRHPHIIDPKAPSEQNQLPNFLDYSRFAAIEEQNTAEEALIPQPELQAQAQRKKLATSLKPTHITITERSTIREASIPQQQGLPGLHIRSENEPVIYKASLTTAIKPPSPERTAIAAWSEQEANVERRLPDHGGASHSPISTSMDASFGQHFSHGFMGLANFYDGLPMGLQIPTLQRPGSAQIGPGNEPLNRSGASVPREAHGSVTPQTPVSFPTPPGTEKSAIINPSTKKRKRDGNERKDSKTEDGADKDTQGKPAPKRARKKDEIQDASENQGQANIMPRRTAPKKASANQVELQRTTPEKSRVQDKRSNDQAQSKPQPAPMPRKAPVLSSQQPTPPKLTAYPSPPNNSPTPLLYQPHPPISPPTLGERQSPTASTPVSIPATASAPKAAPLSHGQFSQQQQQKPRLTRQANLPPPHPIINALLSKMFNRKPISTSWNSRMLDDLTHKLWQYVFQHPQLMDHIRKNASLYSPIKLRILAAADLLPTWWYLRDQCKILFLAKGFGVDDSYMDDQVNRVIKMLSMDNEGANSKAQQAGPQVHRSGHGYGNGNGHGHGDGGLMGY